MLPVIMSSKFGSTCKPWFDDIFWDRAHKAYSVNPSTGAITAVQDTEVLQHAQIRESFLTERERDEPEAIHEAQMDAQQIYSSASTIDNIEFLSFRSNEQGRRLKDEEEVSAPESLAAQTTTRQLLMASDLENATTTPNKATPGAASV